jgi:hypothetical protein
VYYPKKMRFNAQKFLDVLEKSDVKDQFTEEDISNVKQSDGQIVSKSDWDAFFLDEIHYELKLPNGQKVVVAYETCDEIKEGGE